MVSPISNRLRVQRIICLSVAEKLVTRATCLVYRIWLSRAES
jgi:hypothetical protein